MIENELAIFDTLFINYRFFKLVLVGIGKYLLYGVNLIFSFHNFNELFILK